MRRSVHLCAQVLKRAESHGSFKCAEVFNHAHGRVLACGEDCKPAQTSLSVYRGFHSYSKEHVNVRRNFQANAEVSKRAQKCSSVRKSTTRCAPLFPVNKCCAVVCKRSTKKKRQNIDRKSLSRNGESPPPN